MSMGKKQKKSKQKKNRKIKSNNTKNILENEVCNKTELHKDGHEKDIEQRRSARLGAIITIVAVMGSICIFCYKATVAALNMWSVEGVVYKVVQMLFVALLASVICVVIRLVEFIIYDMQRHNVKQNNFHHYDELSDKYYDELISDVKVYLGLMAIIFMAGMILIYFSGNKIARVLAWLLTGLYILILILLLIWIIKKHIKTVLKKIMRWGMIALLCAAFALISITNYKTTVQVQYMQEGVIQICNTSQGDFEGLEITIYDYDTGAGVYNVSVDQQEILLAKEDTYLMSGLDEGKKETAVLVGDEFIHWKYVFNLYDVLEELGTYYVEINVFQDNKHVELINMFKVDGQTFIFGKDSIKKTY